MEKKLDLLRDMLEEYGNVKISKIISVLESYQEKPKSLKEIKIKGESNNGRGCYECAGEHDSIYQDSLFDFLVYEFTYFAKNEDEYFVEVPRKIAERFAELIISGYMGDDYYTSYNFTLSHKLTVDELTSLIAKEICINEDEVEDIEDRGFDEWYERQNKW